MSNSVPAVVATQRINGTILPGTIFTPESAEDHADLVRLDAVREPTEAELLLHEKMQENDAAPAKASRGGRRPSSADTEAAATAEAEAAAAADAAANIG